MLVHAWFSAALSTPHCCLALSDVLLYQQQHGGWDNSGVLLLVNDVSIVYLYNTIVERYGAKDTLVNNLVARLCPNLVADLGNVAYAKGRWSKGDCVSIRITTTTTTKNNDVTLWIIMDQPCARCCMINLCPGTARKDDWYLQVLLNKQQQGR